MCCHPLLLQVGGKCYRSARHYFFPARNCFSKKHKHIASCAGSYLHLWTVNGQPLVSVNTTCSPKSCIACCCFAEVMDWDTRSIIITGSTDGVVRVGGRG